MREEERQGGRERCSSSSDDTRLRVFIRSSLVHTPPTSSVHSMVGAAHERSKFLGTPRELFLRAAAASAQLKQASEIGFAVVISDRANEQLPAARGAASLRRSHERRVMGRGAGWGSK